MALQCWAEGAAALMGTKGHLDNVLFSVITGCAKSPIAFHIFKRVFMFVDVCWASTSGTYTLFKAWPCWQDGKQYLALLVLWESTIQLDLEILNEWETKQIDNKQAKQMPSAVDHFNWASNCLMSYQNFSFQQSLKLTHQKPDHCSELTAFS